MDSIKDALLIYVLPIMLAILIFLIPISCITRCTQLDGSQTDESGTLPLENYDIAVEEGKHFIVNDIEYSFTCKYGSDSSRDSLIHLLDSPILNGHYDNIISDIGEKIKITVKMDIAFLADVTAFGGKMTVFERGPYGLTDACSDTVGGSPYSVYSAGDSTTLTFTFERDIISFYDIQSTKIEYMGRELYFGLPEEEK